MNKKSLGILAGMGPRSTCPFLELVYDECQKQYGAKYDIDYPEIVIYSWPTPFFIDRPIDNIALAQSIETGLHELSQARVSVIAMPCNTAHKYFRRLQESTDIKLLNIVEIACSRISNDSKRITVLGTESTMDMGIYQDSIIQHGKEYHFTDEWQKKVNKIICGIKNRDEKEKTNEEYSDLEDEIMSTGVDTIILACTDLAVIQKTKRKIKVIDSSNELAIELIREYLT